MLQEAGDSWWFFVSIWIALSAIAVFVSVRYTNGSDDMQGADANALHTRLQGATGACALAAAITLCIISAIIGFLTRSSDSAYVMLGICHACLLAAAVVDLCLLLIPNLISLMLIVSRMGLFVYEFLYTQDGMSYLLSSLLALVLCFGVLSLAGKLAKGGIGAGDVKLVSALGFATGLYTAVCTLLIALAVCFAVSVVLMFAKKKAKDSELPFAPFLYIGFVGMVCLSF